MCMWCVWGRIVGKGFILRLYRCPSAIPRLHVPSHSWAQTSQYRSPQGGPVLIHHHHHYYLYISRKMSLLNIGLPQGPPNRPVLVHRNPSRSRDQVVDPSCWWSTDATSSGPWTPLENPLIPQAMCRDHYHLGPAILRAAMTWRQQLYKTQLISS